MGQEVLYCFKCRKRVVSADFAGGQAYQVGNNASCSACAAEFLQTLPPKDREALLARMFKATQERQKSTGTSHAAIPERRPPSTQAQIIASRAPAPPPTNPAIPIGLAVAAVVVLIIAALAFQHKPEPPPPPPAKIVRPDPPKPVVEPVGPRKDAIDRDRADVDGQVRALTAKEQFQAAVDVAQSAKKRHDLPEWATLMDQRIREIRTSAEALYRPAKEQAKTANEIRALRERVQKWGMQEFIADLPDVPERPWTTLMTGIESFRNQGEGWKFADGALTKPSEKSSAIQTKNPFEDLEMRIRFEISGGNMLWFNFRQGAGDTPWNLYWHAQTIPPLVGGVRELIVVCNGDSVTATLDGKPIPVKPGTARKGMLQLNTSVDSGLRILSIETRPLQ